MRVIHIVENLDNSYGGPAKSVLLLVKYLNKLNIDNRIFTIQVFQNEKNSVLEENEILVTKSPVSGIKKIRYSSTFEEEIIKNITKNTIIHVHTVWTYPSYIGYKIAKKYNIPLVVSVRGTMYKWALNQSKYIKKIAMLLFQRSMLNYADVIHITELNERASLRDIGIYNKTVLIPNGVELETGFDYIDKDILNAISYNPSKIYIMFLARIVHNKGLHYLISSYKKIKLKYNNVEVLVVGGVEDRKYFHSLEKLDGMIYLGILEGVKKHTIFSISSLFVLPSKSENFGMAIAEAMSYKIPIITTRGTPWQEIQDKDAGWWVELSQVNIDKALNEALKCDSSKLREKGDKAYNIIKNYTWHKQALKMKNNYIKIGKLKCTY